MHEDITHKDIAHNIDPSCNLIGVFSQPESGVNTSLPAVIFINAGLLHRVGPNRMNTQLARTLAARGYSSLRVDLSGLGDSMTGDHVTDNNTLVAGDLDKSMNFLESEYGVKNFVLVGLCSGAYDTFRRAQEEPRVVGLLNMDGMGYRTPRFYVNHFFIHLLRRAFDVSRWRRLYRRYANQRRVQQTGDQSGEPVQRVGVMTLLAFTDLTLVESGQAIESLARRNVKMHFLFTGGVSGYYNYKNQFHDMFADFDFGDTVTHSYFPQTDHLSMLERHRSAVHGDIVNWVESSFPASTPG